MGALTSDRNTLSKEGKLLSFEMSNVKIYQGAGTVLDSGYLKPAAKALSSATTAGVADETVDNSAGSAGDLSCKVRSDGVFLFNNSANDSLTQADVGKPCFWEDDHTVGSDAAGPLAGRVCKITDEGVWVYISGGIADCSDKLKSQLASEEGAGMIGIKDVSELFESDNVEDALAEIQTSCSPKIFSVPLKDCVANNTVRSMVAAISGACTVVGISLMFYNPPTSAQGTVMITVYKWKKATSEAKALSVAYNLENLVAKESVSLQLTATQGDLVLAGGDSIYAEVVSNNEDMTDGTDGVITMVLVQ